MVLRALGTPALPWELSFAGREAKGGNQKTKVVINYSMFPSDCDQLKLGLGRLA